jgi:hypothetical protein
MTSRLPSVKKNNKADPSGISSSGGSQIPPADVNCLRPVRSTRTRQQDRAIETEPVREEPVLHRQKWPVTYDPQKAKLLPPATKLNMMILSDRARG